MDYQGEEVDTERRVWKKLKANYSMEGRSKEFRRQRMESRGAGQERPKVDGTGRPPAVNLVGFYLFIYLCEEKDLTML